MVLPSAATSLLKHRLDNSELNAARPKRPRLADGSRQRWRAVVLDLDETAGSWGLASLAFKMFLKFAGRPPPTEMFVRQYLERGGARPWLRELLKTLEHWKRVGRLDEVGIFTSASNSQGWVTFLQRCMEEYASTEGLFQCCFTREDSPLAMTDNGMRTVKDLSQVSPDAEQVVLIDDKPHFALNGYVIGVPEYSQDVPSCYLEQCMKEAIPSRAQDIESIFAADASNHPPNSIDFGRDDALLNACRVLDQIFPEEQPTTGAPVSATSCNNTAEWRRCEPQPVCVET